MHFSILPTTGDLSGQQANPKIIREPSLPNGVALESTFARES
jgi:hypothetical protein